MTALVAIVAANESVLGKLHARLTEVLVEALQGQMTESYIDPDTGDVVEGTALPPSAAVLTVAAKFLKDNNITCAPAEDNEMGELQRTLTERQAKLRGKPMDAADRASVMDSLPFMGSA